MDQYAPRNWQPHEKPSLPGSPSTPLHSNPKRLAYALVGLLVAVTGGLGNSLVVANLPYLQGALGATTLGNSPAEFAEYIKQDYAKMQKVVKDANITAN